MWIFTGFYFLQWQYILSSLFPQFFGPGLCPLMFIIYSEPEFVGRDSCYKLLPQHFFVNFQIKSIKLCNELKVGATDLTEPAQTQISTFRFFTMKCQSSTSGPTGIKNWRSRWITDFNIQIFHNWNINPAHIYVQRATGIKKWTSGLITGNDERSSRVVAEAGR